MNIISTIDKYVRMPTIYLAGAALITVLAACSGNGAQSMQTTSPQPTRHTESTKQIDSAQTLEQRIIVETPAPEIIDDPTVTPIPLTPETADPSPLSESTAYNENTNQDINPQQTPGPTLDNNSTASQDNLGYKVDVTATPPPNTPIPEPRYTSTPNPTPNLEVQIATATPAPSPTTIPTVEPMPVRKLFELVCNNCTDEQKEIFYKNALEDYRTVLGVYGINEEDGKLHIIVSDTGFAVDYYVGNRVGSGSEPGNDRFVTDRRGVRHSISHAINETLFPTENQDEPWYNMLNEGLAMYGSGEINRDSGNEWVDLSGINKDGTINTKASGGVPADEAYALLEKNPELFWKRRAFGHYIAGHVIGTDFINIAIRNGLTPEKFRDSVVPSLMEHSQNGKLKKEGIQKSFESADVNIDYGLIQKGIDIVYK